MRPRLVTPFVLGLILATHASAASRESLLVSPDWLAQHLKDPDLVLLHVGDPKTYPGSHLPGARLASLLELSVSDRSGKGLVLEMLPPDLLRQRLEALGISDASRIVVYFAQPAGLTAATRLMFTLDYAGLGERSSLLDGGLEAWTRGGGPVTDAIPAAAAGRLSPLRTKPLVVDAEYVRNNLKAPKVAVIDGRGAGFYDGAQTGGPEAARHLTGHIAGARSVPYSTIAGDGSVLHSAEMLRALFAKAGVAPGDTIVGYCHIGQQATAMLFAARTLGHPVLLYDGSFEDWSRRNFPVETTPTPAR